MRSLIANARISVDAQDLQTARDTLTKAYWTINEARDLIDDDGKNEGDDSSRSSGNSGKKDGGEDKGNKGSNSGSNGDQ